MRIRYDRFERSLDPVAVFVRNDQWRQQFDRVIAVSRDLRQDPVLLQQRNDDQLAEQIRCSPSPANSTMP